MKRPGQVRQHQPGLTNSTWQEVDMAATDSTVKATCRVCAVAFEYQRAAGQRGRQRRFCSIECKTHGGRRKLTLSSCTTCGTDFNPRYVGQQVCSLSCRRKPAFIGPRNKKRWKPGTKRTRDAQCACCGKEFLAGYTGGRTGQFAKFCSARCRAKGRKHAIAKLLSEARIVVSSKRRQCETCSKTFASSQGKYCSEGCRPSYNIWEPVERACACCAIVFTIERKWQRTCSDACQDELERRGRRKAKSARRARLKMLPCENVDPFDVFDRDNWRCQICGIETPKELRGTYHPQAPELDHVMPLALGGSHLWANLQCACRQCNHTKGASHPSEMKLAA